LRQEQDLTKQVNAELGILNNALSLASPDEKDVNLLRQSVDDLKKQRERIHANISARYPRYLEVFARTSASVDDVTSALRDDEALVSFYFGRRRSFAWAVSRSGGLAFHRLRMTAEELEASVTALRQSLDPDTITTISDLPAFDTKAAYELYRRLLMPLEAVWKPSKRLIVVTNGALGILPLSLLPTEPTEAIQVAGSGDLAFADYRKVPWLARTHAVSVAPSASTFTMLRRLPAGPSGREPLIGFGDPIFSQQQAEERRTGGETLVSRALPLQRRALPKMRALERAALSRLPPLPDTADELKAIAAVLHARPDEALQLGLQANEANVKTRDLQRYRVVIFATHGLMAGELDGLTQPALALTAPEVAGVEGDGLLTLDEILALRLNADWVVLSACNTNSGLGAAAGPATGLARAFFYAGTRALLVTNWSVHSEAARELTTTLFGVQAAELGLSRAEALRRAMVELIDHKGFMDGDGRLLFSYAHPLFWAPFSVLGDGG
jgi:CHAT domain-containing protein